VFVINGFTFAATLLSLLLLRRGELRIAPRAARGPGQLKAGIVYVRRRPDLLVVFVIVFLVGTFGLNFPIFAATMASVEFHHGAGEFGLLSSMLAIGSVIGALLAARRERPRLRVVFASAGAFGIACVVAALMPTYWSFGLALIVVGFTSITLLTTANGTVQTTTAPVMRGRVMALYLAIFLGGTPIGAPIIGWVANEFGPRSAIVVGGSSGLVAALIGVTWMVARHELRLRVDRSNGIRVYLTHDRSAQNLADRLAVDESLARR
jgi:MFS family permease